jgi:hypothetical protein
LSLVFFLVFFLSLSLVSVFSYSPFKSVLTPVANNPRDATAREPPRSTMLAIVPPWRMFKRFWIVREMKENVSSEFWLDNP